MDLQFSLYLVPLLFAAAISTVLAGFVFLKRHKRTAPQILGVLVAAAIWSVADAMRLASVDPASKLLWQNVRFVGSTLVVLAVFLHALEYTNREEWITRRTIAAFAAVFVVTNVLVWTEGALGHDLVHAGYETVQFDSTWPVDVGSVSLIQFEFGPWFYVNAAYSYLLLVFAAGMYGVAFLRRSGTYRLQTGGLLLGTFVPWGMNAIYLAGWSVVDLTAFGFTVTGIVFVWQFSQFQLLDIVPVARSTVINQIENGYLVVDTEGRVLDVNDAGADLLQRPREAIIGATIAELWSDYPDIVETFGTVRNTRRDVTFVVDGDRRDYDVDVSPVHDDHDQYVGRVILIRDVTAERRRQRKLEERTEALERQNERLDQFASVVSHDLRNPLAVAKGNLEIATADGSPEHLAHVEEALERMEEITEDVLALARQGGELSAVERLELDALAEEAWRTVETADATLEVETTRTVPADRSRLRRALENLFRNSLEHGSQDVTVRIGDLEDGSGFFVEDDGPGIPAEEREHVIEPGVSTNESGTGFGLSIVAATAEAHGWTFRIEAGREGGARFEFGGVDDAEHWGTDAAGSGTASRAEVFVDGDQAADPDSGSCGERVGPSDVESSDASDAGSSPAASEEQSAGSDARTGTDTDADTDTAADGTLD